MLIKSSVTIIIIPVDCSNIIIICDYKSFILSFYLESDVNDGAIRDNLLVGGSIIYN